MCKILHYTLEQIIGNIRLYTEIWVREDFTELCIDDVEEIVMIPSTKENYLALKALWFSGYVSANPRTVHNLYIAQMRNNGNTGSLVGSSI